MRSPVGISAFEGLDSAGGGGEAALVGAGSDFGGSGSFVVSFGPSEEAWAAMSAAAEMSSPSSPTIAIGDPTLIFLDPSGA